ncbi:MAG: BrnT family toxin [Vitreimonas sp.]
MPKPVPEFDWDDRKAARNYAKHGVSFAAVKDFDFATARETEDLRWGYGETRMLALGRIGRILHALVYTKPTEEVVRVISLRKATAQEREAYFAAGGQ